MATVPERIHESTAGAASGTWTALLDRLGPYTSWLVVGLVLVAYAALSVSLLLGAATIALVVAGTAPGGVGTTVGFAIGLATVAAAPTVARTLVARGSLWIRDACTA